MKVYLFGWPGMMGGASTKFAHLIWLFHGRYDLTVVALDATDLLDECWTSWFRENRIRYCGLDDLPKRLKGWGISICNSLFIGTPQWVDVRRRGLKMAWGNEMMWLLPQEAGAITLAQVDAILYVSPAQRQILEPHYRRLIKGGLSSEPFRPGKNAVTGWIEGNNPKERVRWVMVGNYISPAAFPFRDRRPTATSGLTIGRLSRPDPAKFPNDFPKSYESLGLKDPTFRVMAWSPQLAAKWPRHSFDTRWDLLPFSPDTVTFLQSLDLFVYELGPDCRESWGRAVVEAMLTGAIPLVPAGREHHLHKLIAHGKSGFLCRHRADFARYATYLQDRPAVRARISRQCRQWAVRRLCNARAHIQVWNELFHCSNQS